MGAPKRRLFVPLVFSSGLVLLLLFVLQAARPQVGVASVLTEDVTQNITSDTTWTRDNDPYILTTEILVVPGVTLTIEPGVVVQGQTDGQLRVQGRLVALGTLTRPITFTSVNDSGPLGWEGLVFDGGTGHLDHTTVRYAGFSNRIKRANIVVSGVLTGQVRIENSYVLSEGMDGVQDYGLYIVDSRVVVSGTTFSGNHATGFQSSDDYALYADGDSTVITLTNNTFSDNDYPARVQVSHLSSVWMTGNSFQDNVENRVLIGGGTLDQEAPLPSQMGLEGYELDGTFSAPPGVTLTVAPGVTVIARSNAALQVQGRLEALGTPAQPIVFTADNLSTGWGGLVLDGGVGELRDVTLSYGGSAPGGGLRSNASVDGGQLRLEDSHVLNEVGLDFRADYGLYVVDSQALVSGTTFSDNGSDEYSDFALYYASGSSTVITLTGNSFENNGAYAVGVPAANFHQLWMADNAFSGSGNRARRVYIAGGSLATSVSLIWQSGLEGYALDDPLTVPGGVTLTVEPQAAIIGRDDANLNVQGRLMALGTLSRPITFTADDALVGWEGLLLDGGVGELRHVTVGQGSGGVNSNVTVQGGQLRIEDSYVQGKVGVPGDNDYGVHADNSQVIISGTQFSDIGSAPGDYALYATGGSTVITATTSVWQANSSGIGVDGGQVVLSCVDLLNNTREGMRVNGGAASVVGSAFSGNPDFGLNNTSGVGVSAIYNWWGDASGPGGVGPGTGDGVSSDVVYTPWLGAPVCVLDLAVEKVAWPDPVYVEDPLVYTITVANHSPAPATGVVLTDKLPLNFSFGSATPSQGSCGGTDEVVTCTLGVLAGRAHAAYADATVTLVVTPSVEAVGVVTNSVVITSQELDPWTDNSSVSITSVVEPKVDLVVAKFDEPDPAGTGIRLTYTLVITNHGPSTATGVALTDSLPVAAALPVSVTYISALASQGTGCGEANGVVTCALGDIPRDDTVTATILVTVTGAGTLTNVASVAGNEFDDDLTNNVVTETTSVATADLALAKFGSPGTLRVGEGLTYTLVVTNNGPLPATDVSLVDTLPLSVTFDTLVSGSCEHNAVDHAVTCDLGALDVGLTATVVYVVQAAAGGTLTNTASVASNEYDPEPENSTAWSASVVPVADLAVAKTDAPDPLAVGETLTYTIAVTNNGPWPDAGVVLTDELPLSVNGVLATASQGDCDVGGGLVVCDLGALADQATAHVTVTAQPMAAGMIRNTVNVSGLEFDPYPANNTMETQTSVGIARLAVHKSATPQAAWMGQPLTYTLTITNDGPDAATDVTFTDTLPLSVNLVLVTSSQGDCGANGVLSMPLFVCHMGALPDGGGATATLVVTPTATGLMTNTVQVRASESDPDLTDNQDWASVTVRSGWEVYLPLVIKSE